MGHHLLQVIWMERVEDVEEIGSRWSLASWIFVREVGLELIVLHELRVQRLHGQLIIVWHLDGVDIGFLHQLLLSCKDLFEEVLVDH